MQRAKLAWSLRRASRLPAARFAAADIRARFDAAKDCRAVGHVSGIGESRDGPPIRHALEIWGWGAPAARSGVLDDSPGRWSALTTIPCSRSAALGVQGLPSDRQITGRSRGSHFLQEVTSQCRTSDGWIFQCALLGTYCAAKRKAPGLGFKMEAGGFCSCKGPAYRLTWRLVPLPGAPLPLSPLETTFTQSASFSL